VLKRYHASVCESVTSLMGWREKARCLPARQNDAIGPSVWTGRALQAESDDLAPKGHLITNALARAFSISSFRLARSLAVTE